MMNNIKKISISGIIAVCVIFSFAGFLHYSPQPIRWIDDLDIAGPRQL